MFFAKTDSENEPLQPLPSEAVYILGANPLGLYLASRFTEGGERPILIGSAQALAKINQEFIIKDERFINRQKFTPVVTNSIRVKPKALIITTDSSQLKAQLLTILPAKIENIPIFLFTMLKDDSFVSSCLRQPIINAYFHGCLSADRNSISLIGRQNTICLNCSADHEKFQLIDLLFRKTNIETVFESDNKRALWNYLAPYATVSLLSAAYGKNIYHLTKDETHRRELDLLIEEIQKLALIDNVVLEHTSILKTIYNIPSAYTSALQNALFIRDSKEIDNFSSLFLSLCEKAQAQPPVLNHLLSILYNKTLV